MTGLKMLQEGNQKIVKIILSFPGGPFLKCLILSKNGIMIE